MRLIYTEGFGMVELSQHIQNDATSCGIYSLKVVSLVQTILVEYFIKYVR